MKNFNKNTVVSAFLFTSLLTSGQVARAGESLEVRTARDCKAMAVRHGLKTVGDNYGQAYDEVTLGSIDRAMPAGSLIDPKVGEIEGYANFEITAIRESADPVAYEMAVRSRPDKKTGKLTCQIAKEAQRDLLSP